MYGLALVYFENKPLHNFVLPSATNYEPINIEVSTLFSDVVPTLAALSSEVELPCSISFGDGATAKLFVNKTATCYTFVVVHPAFAVTYTISNAAKRLEVCWYGLDLRYYVAQILQHPVMVYLAQLHGKVCLHANVMQHQGQTIAIVGESGAGKSTLSAMLWHKGCQVVADDVCAMNYTDEAVVVWTGSQRLKVSPELAQMVQKKGCSLEAVYPNPFSDEPPLDPKVQKVYLDDPAETKLENGFYTLNTIFILKPRNKALLRPVIKTLKPIEVIPILLANMTLSDLMTEKDKFDAFHFMAKVAQKVVIKTLECPDSIDLLGQTADSILQHLETTSI